MDQAGSGSGVWCRASQGGGGRHDGAMATDDNAARRGARAREPGMIHTRGPSGWCRGGGPATAGADAARPAARSGRAW
ncbi:hypothetical protein E2C11_24155 [Streptomyces lavendulae]|nr:hypothetical protein E2C11_24155 [Streptomyces lavendulae]